MLKKRIVMLLMVSLLVLSLAACGKEDTKQEEEAALQEEVEKDNLEKDSAVELNGISSDDLVMTVGDEEISYREALSYIYMVKRQYESSLGDEIWTIDMGKKQSFGEYAREQIKSQMISLKIIKQKSKELDVSLTEDEKQEAKRLAEDFVESADAKEAEKYGVTVNVMTGIYRDNLLAKKVYDVVTSSVDTSISEAEAKQITVQYLMTMTKGTNKDGSKVNLSDSEKETARANTQLLRDQIKNGSDFYAIAEKNTDAPEVEISFGELDAPKDFGKEAMQLKTGEISDVIKGENGYYIVYCVNANDEAAMEERKEEIIDARQSEEFRKQYASWTGDFKVILNKEIWNSVEVSR
ncbi:MAG: peptidylprolyl isomerase [Lachnospiraceae bacterium]|nr:peptidylprolyl isomerase [Lachnospiraceae bacterium]